MVLNGGCKNESGQTSRPVKDLLYQVYVEDSTKKIDFITFVDEMVNDTNDCRRAKIATIQVDSAIYLEMILRTPQRARRKDTLYMFSLHRGDHKVTFGENTVCLRSQAADYLPSGLVDAYLLEEYEIDSSSIPFKQKTAKFVCVYLLKGKDWMEAKRCFYDLPIDTSQMYVGIASGEKDELLSDSLTWIYADQAARLEEDAIKSLTKKYKPKG